MFVVRAVRDYPMSLKPGRLYRVRVNACTNYLRGRGAFVMARSRFGPVGYPSYVVTLLRNTFPGSGTVCGPFFRYENLSH